MDADQVRAQLQELREDLERRSVRNPKSSRSSAGREANAAGLEDIDRAMRMLDSGTYGLCEACGEPIAPERLDVNPAARFCRADQQSQER